MLQLIQIQIILFNTNTIVIGANTIGNGSNSVTLGNDSILNTWLNGDTIIKIGGFEGMLTHANTVNRTYTLPDVTGTVALESAITEVLTFGGGASGDVATMTVTGGIITARTLVP